MSAEPTALPAGTPVDVIPAHIVRTPGCRSGRPHIRGTKITVGDIATYAMFYGMTVDQIVADWDHLTRADVHAALAYYWDHKDEIDAEEDEDIAFAEQMKREHPDRISDFHA